jgi:hypothetical protein
MHSKKEAASILGASYSSMKKSPQAYAEGGTTIGALDAGRRIGMPPLVGRRDQR